MGSSRARLPEGNVQGRAAIVSPKQGQSGDFGKVDVPGFGCELTSGQESYRNLTRSEFDFEADFFYDFDGGFRVFFSKGSESRISRSIAATSIDFRIVCSLSSL